MERRLQCDLTHSQYDRAVQLFEEALQKVRDATDLLGELDHISYDYNEHGDTKAREAFDRLHSAIDFPHHSIIEDGNEWWPVATNEVDDINGAMEEWARAKGTKNERGTN